MKSCIEWRKGFKYLPEIDEFIINYKENKSRQLVNFLNEYAKSQRVIIRVEDSIEKKDIDFLALLATQNEYEIAILFEKLYPANIKKEDLQSIEIPFFFNTIATNWEILREMLELGVSDIYIGGMLGFDLERVNKFVPVNIQIRSYANICQYEWDNSKGFKTFFIRPEDLNYYSNFIDVIEFYKSEDIQNTLYEVYFHSKEWNGNLREIIKGLRVDINNYYILGSEFARRRAQCRRKCIKGERCELCDGLIDLAKTLEESKEYDVFKRRMING